MLIDLSQEIKRDDGSSIVSEKKSFNVKKNEAGEWQAEPDVTFSEKTTLGDMCRSALISGLVKIDVSETMQRYALYNKIKEDTKVELSDEELDIIKELVNNKWELLMAGKILTLLGAK